MPGDLARPQLLEAMRHLEPSQDIRAVFQYQNLGYLAAGMVAERITGESWEDFTRERLTDPLGMTVSFTPEDLAAGPDAAVPYAMKGAERLRAHYWPIRDTPAGGINASIIGIAAWLRFHLGGGEIEGRRLLSAALAGELQVPRVWVMASEFGEIGHSHYGLGFGTYPYRGERVVSHGGGWIGWGTLLSFMPERGIGVAVFTNRDPSPVPELLTHFIFDRLTGKEPVPWLERHLERRRQFLAQLESSRKARQATRREGASPSHALADYVGDYEHPGYGRIVISEAGSESGTESGNDAAAGAGDGAGKPAGGRLHWAWRGLTAPLAHRHYDTFELPEQPDRLLPDNLLVSFATDREGNIASLSAPFEPMVKDIVFQRLPSGACTDPLFLKACLGIFRSGPTTHLVKLDAEGQLTLAPTNQPTYRLRPYQGTTFTIVELPGFRVEFLRGPDGVVGEVVFHQPNGVFIAPREPASA
jgi:hypothetical protein